MTRRRGGPPGGAPRPGRRALLASPATGWAGQAAAQPAAGGPGGLRDVAARHGVAFGLAVQARPLAADAPYAAATAREAGVLVPEGAGKWWTLRPAEGRFEFAPLDAIASFAARHGQRVRGHTLVWHAAMRPWAEAAIAEGPARARALLEEHLDRVLGHTAPAIRDWDVANEAVADPWNSTELLKDSPWPRALGPGYLELAFRLARRRDPGLVLTYNDYGCEHDAPHDDEKRRRVLALARGFRDRGVPIDAVGLQGHLHRDLPFSAAAVTRFVRALRDLDLAVPITELDVIEPEIHGPPGGVAPAPGAALPPALDPADVAARDARAAARVHAFVSAVLEGGGGQAVLAWGVADHHSWANDPAPKGARPLPLDDGFRPKPMWHALARAFAGQPWP